MNSAGVAAGKERQTQTYRDKNKEIDRRIKKTTAGEILTHPFCLYPLNEDK